MRQIVTRFERDTLRHPLTQTVVLYVTGALLALVVPAPVAIVTTFLVLCVFVIVNPLALASAPRWWLRGPLSAVCFVFLLGLLGATTEAISGRKFGDDAMVFLAPFMFYMVALPASGVVRMIRYFRGKQTT